MQDPLFLADLLQAEFHKSLLYKKNFYFKMEKYRVTGWDFYRDDCTKLILSVSLYLLFPATLNFLSVPNHRMSHKKITLKTNWINLSIVGFKEVQWPNLKNLSGGLNLSRGLNMVASTKTCIKCLKIQAGA